jgi:chemotaxis protein CheZ
MASVPKQNNEDYRLPLERMLAALDAADGETFNRELEALTRMREQNLFREIGKLTRELHDALNAFQIDNRIGDFVEREMPDARVRLNSVIYMTANAAHRSLGLVEAAMPECEALRTRTRQLAAGLDGHQESDVGEFLQFCEATADRWRANLSELLMAQDYQDLSGQLIRKVIALVERVESALVELVRLSGRQLGSTGPAAVESVEGQDQVDELLSSLGF